MDLWKCGLWELDQSLSTQWMQSVCRYCAACKASGLPDQADCGQTEMAALHLEILGFNLHAIVCFTNHELQDKLARE